jgi:hypothetical protein
MRRNGTLFAVVVKGAGFDKGCHDPDVLLTDGVAEAVVIFREFAKQVAVVNQMERSKAPVNLFIRIHD